MSQTRLGTILRIQPMDRLADLATDVIELDRPLPHPWVISPSVCQLSLDILTFLPHPTLKG